MGEREGGKSVHGSPAPARCSEQDRRASDIVVVTRTCSCRLGNGTWDQE